MPDKNQLDRIVISSARLLKLPISNRLMKRLILSLVLLGTILFGGCKKNNNPAPEPFFKFNFESKTMDIKDYQKIDSTSFTTSYKPSEIHFESTDSKILSVEKGGVGYQMLSAVGKGTVYIKAMKGAAELGRFKVTVSYVPITAMSISGSVERTITEVQETSLQISIAPLNSTNMQLTWTVSDPSVVIKWAEERNAVIIGDHPGTAVVTATSPDGFKVSVKVTVTALPPYPKTGVDAVVKSFNENILPMLDRESDLIIKKLTILPGIREKQVTAFDWAGQLKLILSVESASGFYRYPLPATPIKGFTFLFWTENTNPPVNNAGLKIAVNFFGDHFEVVPKSGSVPRVFNYNQVSEFTKFLLESIQADVASIKKEFPTYF